MSPIPSCVQNSAQTRPVVRKTACGKIWAHVPSLHRDRLRSEFLFPMVFGIIQTAKGFRLGVILATTGLFVAEGD